MKAQKQCPACKKHVHARKLKCEHCGHDFYKPEPKREAPKEKRTEYSGELRKLITPAGVPPVEIKDWTVEGLREWEEKIQAHMAKEGFVLSNDGLAYWARKFYCFWKDKEKENLVLSVWNI